jgi:hypothetical protein
VQSCTGSRVCFSRLRAATRRGLKPRSVKQSASQSSKSRLYSRNAQKQPMRNTATKKRARQPRVDFDYLSGDLRTVRRSPFAGRISEFRVH